MALRLTIHPNPVPQGRGEYVYRVEVTAAVPVRLEQVQMTIGDYQRQWPAAEFFPNTSLAAGGVVAGTGRNLARSEGAVTRWTVTGTRGDTGVGVAAVAQVLLGLPPGAERLFYRRAPAREGVLCLPPGPGPHPGLILVHGTGASAGSLAWLAADAAAHGYAGLAVSQPGWGGSAGPLDFAGPATWQALLDALAWLQMHPRVDPGRIALWGVSRGAIAAAMAAVHTRDLRALVLQSGAYDLTALGVDFRARVAREIAPAAGGGVEGALAERSACHRARDVHSPVLLVHGARDEVLPASQSEQLYRRLRDLGKRAELVILPGQGHFLPPGPLWEGTIYPFLARCGLV